MASPPPFPGGSRSRVDRAGDAVRHSTASEEDYTVIEAWREAHRDVLNTFQAILRYRTRDTDIVVAQRHKRRRTIFGKLRRYPKMRLSRMDDVAGCRLIFPDIESLYSFRESLQRARFNHSRRNSDDKYDYIKNPKPSGYRGLHDVYSYDVRPYRVPVDQLIFGELAPNPLKGLLVEIQYRTRLQHSWATAVEVIGQITNNQPKFNQGDRRYLRAMALASELLARVFEARHGPFPELTAHDLVHQFRRLDAELRLLSTLSALTTSSLPPPSAKANTILVLSADSHLDVFTHRNATDAFQHLFRLEKEDGDRDIVLVRASDAKDLRLAFKNYFSDAQDFVEQVERACREVLVTA